VFAIGGNATAAHLSGIKVKNIRVALFVIAGMLAATTAVLLTARNGVGDASVSRSGLEFNVISAVVVGGTALTGGRGSILGTLLGIFVISLIVPSAKGRSRPQGLSLIHISSPIPVRNPAMTKIEAKPAIASVNELFSKSPDGLREIVRAVMQEMLEACLLYTSRCV